MTGTEVAKAKFYTFGQNNSGGSFVYRPLEGIGHYVIFEALDSEHALARARQAGLYFDGVEIGYDCGCCGDRWSDYPPEPTDIPTVYGETIEGYLFGTPEYAKFGMDKQVFVHYLTGQITAH